MRQEMLSFVRTFYSHFDTVFFTDFEVEGYTKRICGKWEKCGYKVWWTNKPIYIIMSLFLMRLGFIGLLSQLQPSTHASQ